MGLSRLTCMIIASTDVLPLANGPDENGKWQGIIAHGKSHPVHPYMPVASTDFHYATQDNAIEAMKEQIQKIREHMEHGE